jgi:beta-glucanase (GH16 family)
MVSNKFSAAVVAIAGAQLVAAQTHSACKPTERDCPDAPAFGDGVHVIDFTKGASDEFGIAAGTTLTYDNSKGAVFTIAKEGQAPTITTHKYLHFGTVEVITQAAPGAGIVSSVVLQADDLDEIDYEWVGTDDKQVQSNYFSKGDDSTFDRGGYHPVANPQTTFNNYTIDWTQDYVRWYINGGMVRELTYQQAKGGKTFPQAPCQVKLGTWVAGGPKAPEGTAKWAGGYTDFNQVPFIAYYQKVTIRDRQKGESGAKAYHYGDRSGTWQSVQVIKGDGSSNGGSQSASSSASSSSSAAPTTLSTSSKTESTQSTVTTPAPTGGNGGNGGNPSNQTGTSSSARPTTSGPATAPNAGAQSAVSFFGLGAALFLTSLFL